MAGQATPIQIIGVCATLIVVSAGWNAFAVSALGERYQRDLQAVRSVINEHEARNIREHARMTKAAQDHSNNRRAGMFTEAMFEARMVIRDESIKDLWSGANQCVTDRATMKAVQDQFEKWITLLARKQDSLTEQVIPDMKVAIRSATSRVEINGDEMIKIGHKQDDVREKLIPTLSRRVERIEENLRTRASNGNK